ncbi:uncharacterized protein LOC111832460 [Capsella rubella]|uniref:uncharacterized protein LOC111832460 n=1 Tax=Capsella rubella TaxID=81985 RepID=UPI000CD4C83F|nr:uncharacterized protein LOC111832460 [Capsella rubella]
MEQMDVKRDSPVGSVELATTETKKSDNVDKGSSSKNEMQQILRVKLDDFKKQIKMLERMIPKIGDSSRKNALQLYLDDMKPTVENAEALLGKFKFEEKDFSRIVESIKVAKSEVLDRLSFEKKMIQQDKRKK